MRRLSTTSSASPSTGDSSRTRPTCSGQTARRYALFWICMASRSRSSVTSPLCPRGSPWSLACSWSVGSCGCWGSRNWPGRTSSWSAGHENRGSPAGQTAAFRRSVTSAGDPPFSRTWIAASLRTRGIVVCCARRRAPGARAGSTSGSRSRGRASQIAIGHPMPDTCRTLDTGPRKGGCE